MAIAGDDILTLMGAPGSPYTRKMLAVLRYRRIPYRLLIGSHGTEGLPQARPSLLPTFYLPGADGALEAVTDSTPLIRRFEAQFPGRSVIPSDPALALIDALIEDFADEWLTKAMFHYRWSYADDIARAGMILPTWHRGPFDDARHAALAEEISSRQISRLRYVGSTAQTGPVIEASYARFLDAFEDHLRSYRFLLGARPGAGDFGVFGQLTQLAHFDPTPMALTLARAPRAFGWVMNTEDRSGLEPTDADWFDPTTLPPTVGAILGEIGRVYAPLLLANARALQSGASEVSLVIDGATWVQQPFAYQAKCLGWLRRDHASLSPAAQARFDSAIVDSGCEALFAFPSTRIT